MVVVLTWATVPLCMGGTGFGGFLDLREVFFLAKCLGAVLPPAGRVFFKEGLPMISSFLIFL